MRLKGRGLYGGGDEVEFLPLVNGKTARAGAYFDEIFLNKRVGHFMLLALSWFGSMHLADGANMFHVKADAIKAGDVLLERWQRRGIGHTIPVMRAVWVESDRLELVVATGSMPRRYPKWEEGPAAGRYFKDESAGGPGENSDGDAYAALGGGLGAGGCQPSKLDAIGIPFSTANVRCGSTAVTKKQSRNVRTIFPIL